MKRLVGLLCVLAFLGGCLGAPDGDVSQVTDAGSSGYVFDDEPTKPAGETASTATVPEGDGRLEMKPETETETPMPTQDTQPEPKEIGGDPVQRMACQRQKGTFTKTPAGFYVCVRETGELRKSCTTSTQCAGVCLARSGTCAPYQPLVGCHDVITAGGGMATMCID